MAKTSKDSEAIDGKDGGQLRIYTDGACTGNPGPGGWAVCYRESGRMVEQCGQEARTTNNRMEMTAALAALRVAAGRPVTLVTDSQYLLRGITAWIRQWKRREWKTVTGNPVLNVDLWTQIDALNGQNVRWEWVRGHSGHPENERCDALAQAQARKAAATAQAASARPRNGSVAEAPAPRRSPASAFEPAGNADPFADDAPTGASPDLDTWVGVRYLSLTPSGLLRHRTWPECLARVHRVPGARFKKCRSEAEERAVAADWGRRWSEIEDDL